MITNGNVPSWDEKLAFCSNAYYVNGQGNFWFAGSTFSDKYAIGHGILTINNQDSISITKDILNPIIPSNVINPNDYGSSCGKVIVENQNGTNLFKMWFTRFASPGFSFSAYYTTSNNGINWDVPIPIQITLPNTADSVSAPSVIFNSDLNKYVMVFTSRYLPEGGRWKLGFAESVDGINWINVTYPIFGGELDWEGNDISNAQIFYKDHIYYIFYDGDSSLYYATSNNGIDWYKNKTTLLLEKGNGSSFDNVRVKDPYVIDYQNQYYLFYTGWNGSRYQIGVATSNELPPIVTPSISPTITLSPSPTMNPPTSTPIPSPTIFIGKKPVVFIPGLGASWNQADIFSCNLSQSNTWTLAPYVHVYDRLINTFTKKVGLKQNKDFYIYGFDWRQSLQTAGDKLKSYLDSIPSQKVDIVSHSLGGLVARTYIQQNPLDHKVDKLITLGSPHEGTVLAYPLWENGEVNIDNLIDKTSINAVLNICRVKISPFSLATKRQVIHTMVPSIKDILPTFDFIYKNNSLITTDLLDGENTWLKNHPFTLPFGNTDLLTIGGDGKKTSNSINVKNTSVKDLVKGNWIDGEPVKFNNVSEGDGTVLRTSSVLSLANQATFPVDHIGLVNDQGSIQKILEFLGYDKNAIAAREVIPEEGPQSSFLITTSIPSLLTLSTLDNKLIQSSDKGVLVEYGDSPKTYKLKVKPLTSDNPTLFIGQNGKSENWKEYSVKLKKNAEKQFLVTYNPLKAPVNPLSPF